MKAEELRIGNYVYYQIVDSEDPRYEYWDFNKIDAEDILYLSKNPDNKSYRPIMLSEEALLEFRFYKLAKEVFSKTENDEFKSTFIINWDDHLNLFKVAFTGFWYEIKYLHQLQNLYFALTGKEL